MNFVDKELPIKLSNGEVSNLVWERESGDLEQKFGDLVIVVLDDYWDYVLGNPDAQNPLVASLAKLRLWACEELPETQAIGFFVLPGKRKDADEILLFIQKWVEDVNPPDHNIRVCFLVDAMYGSEGDETVEPANYIVEKLADSPLADCIAYLTQAGSGVAGLKPGYLIFSKSDETNYVRNHGVFTSEFMAFLGIELHKDKIIESAIQFYATPWKVGRLGCQHDYSGWCHDCLEQRSSEQLRALADWLRDSISICDLYDWQKGQSAKSLMIWVGERLWGTRRRIQGEVLKASMEKLEIPLSKTKPIPAKPIKMPCTPCLPFLISLRSFLLCSEKQGVPVSEIQFFQNDEHCGFRLILQEYLCDPNRLKSRYCGIKSRYGKYPPREHPLTKSLIELTYCITDGLEDIGRDYMHLFTDGAAKRTIEKTEASVVEVKEIAESYIDLIW